MVVDKQLAKEEEKMKRIILFILIGMFLISGCDGIKPPSIPNCNEWAESLTPENFTLILEGLNFIGDISGKASWVFPMKDKDIRTVWNDGERITGYSASFYQGSEEGENINYYYPAAKEAKFYYEGEQIISDEGVILGHNSFTLKVNLIKPILESEREGMVRIWNEKVYQLKIVDFEIIDSELVGCNFIE